MKIKKLAYCLAGLLFLVSLGFNIFQYQRNKIISEKFITGKIVKGDSFNDSNSVSGSGPAKMVQNNSALLIKEEKSGPGDVNELENQLNTTEEEIDKTSEQLIEELSSKAEFKKNYAQFSKNMSSNPDYEKSLAENAKKMLREYDPLYKKLNLSDEEVAQFKAILADRIMEIRNAVLPNSLTASDEELAEMNQHMMEINIRYREKINEVLSEENIKIYWAYQQSLSERTNLNYFMETVPPDIRISEDQTEALIDTMYAARKAIYDEMGPDIDMNSSVDLTEENIARQIEKTKLVYDKYAEAISGLLPDEQVEQYKSFLKRNLEGTESMMKTRMFMKINK